MKTYKAVPRKAMLTSALLAVLAGPAWAQDPAARETTTTAPDGVDPTTLDTVQVTGIRGSLTSSMNLKRDSQGVVDGIVAEDIGKFPDTNLAESLQRISGVSIDRTASGEGSKVTVRGIGPDYNLVLLNGRQMPASNLGAGGAGLNSSRSSISPTWPPNRCRRWRSTRPAVPTIRPVASVRRSTSRRCARWSPNR